LPLALIAPLQADDAGIALLNGDHGGVPFCALIVCGNSIHRSEIRGPDGGCQGVIVWTFVIRISSLEFFIFYDPMRVDFRQSSDNLRFQDDRIAEIAATE